MPSTCIACRSGYRLVPDLGPPSRMVCGYLTENIKGCIQHNDDGTKCHSCGGSRLISIYPTDKCFETGDSCSQEYGYNKIGSTRCDSCKGTNEPLCYCPEAMLHSDPNCIPKCKCSVQNCKQFSKLQLTPRREVCFWRPFKMRGM